MTISSGSNRFAWADTIRNEARHFFTAARTSEAVATFPCIRDGLVRVGGTHTITHRDRTGPARSVLPTATRQAPEPEGEDPATGPIVVDVVRPGRGLLTCREFGGQLIREGGRYVVETEFGHTVGRASSYRAGAQLLARHHGYRPGPIEIDRREERDGNTPPKPTARDRQLGR